MMKNLSNSEISHIIDEWIHSERGRQLLKRRFIDGVTYEKIAEEFDLSVIQTKTIVYNCEKYLIKHL